MTKIDWSRHRYDGKPTTQIGRKKPKSGPMTKAEKKAVAERKAAREDRLKPGLLALEAAAFKANRPPAK